jgi:hypothetical protein
MPVVDVKCSKCGLVVEDLFLRVLKPESMPGCSCGGVMERIWGGKAPSDHTWKPYWENNLGPERVWIDSKKTLAREAAKRNLTAKCLD